MNVNGKRVFITGGSSGIGLALVQALLAKGAMPPVRATDVRQRLWGTDRFGANTVKIYQ
jgi:NAD(P)-dependent dehydrogenase (short-subunit alcohol dehydrogenase family)